MLFVSARQYQNYRREKDYIKYYESSLEKEHFILVIYYGIFYSNKRVYLLLF